MSSREDVRLSNTILDRLVEAYRKLRNTFRYALGNLHDFDPAKDAVPVEEMLEIDRWILARAEDVVRRCREYYDELAFHKVYRAIYDFATTDLSALYFDVLKDRLYTSATRSRARRSGQTALYRIHYALTRLIAPLLSFTAEEVWSYTAKPAGAPESVHIALFPEPEELASGLDAAATGELGASDGGPRRRAEGARRSAAGEVHRRAARSAGAVAGVCRARGFFAATCRRCSSCRRWFSIQASKRE